LVSALEGLSDKGRSDFAFDFILRRYIVAGAIIGSVAALACWPW
jgi:hypothetical protein